MDRYRLMERCEVEVGAAGELQGIEHTGDFVLFVLHKCGKWTPRDGLVCAYCGAGPFDDEEDYVADEQDEDHDEDDFDDGDCEDDESPPVVLPAILPKSIPRHRG